MPDTLPWLLTCTLAPVAAILLGGCLSVARPQGKPLISAFEHFAAGVVFSAVAIELLPRLHEIVGRYRWSQASSPACWP